jgi:hypothetical protein
MVAMEVTHVVAPIILPTLVLRTFARRLDENRKSSKIILYKDNSTLQPVPLPPSSPWKKFRKGLELLDAFPSTSSLPVTPPATSKKDDTKLVRRKSSSTALPPSEQSTRHFGKSNNHNFPTPVDISSSCSPSPQQVPYSWSLNEPRPYWIWPKEDKDWKKLNKDLEIQLDSSMKTIPEKAVDIVNHFQSSLFACLDSLLPQKPMAKPKDATNVKKAVDGFNKRKASVPTEQAMNDLKERKRKARSQLRIALKDSTGTGSDKVKLCRKLHNEIVRLHHAVLRVQKRDKASLTKQDDLKQFLKNPWKVATEIFRDGPEPSGIPECSAEEVRSHLQKSWKDPNPTLTDYVNPKNVKDLPDPKTSFDLSAIGEDELKRIIISKSSTSSPTPFDPVPYRVYKRCECLTKYVLMVFNALRSAMMAMEYPADLWSDLWLTQIYKGKGKPRNLPTSFRQILQESPLAKLWHSVWASRMTRFLVKNDYLDKAQTAGLPGVSGTLEIQCVMDQLIKQARTSARNLIAHAADFQDAYGSVRHKLILFAAKFHRLPAEILHFLENMLKNLRVTGDVNGNRIVADYLNGVITGDPLSVILFIMVMNIGLRRLNVEDNLGCKVHSQDASKAAFMDDVVQMTFSPEKAKRQICLFYEFVEWTQCMKLHPDKLEVFALNNKEPFDPELKVQVRDDVVLHYKQCENHLRVLGKEWSYKKNDADIRESIRSEWARILKSVNKKYLPGNRKIELADMIFKGFSQWKLTIYDLPMSFGQSLLELWLSYLKDWSGLARPANTAVFFLPKSERGLGLINPLLLLRQCQVSRRCILLQSRNPLVKKIAMEKLRDERAKADRAQTERKTFRPWIEALALMEKAQKTASENDRILSPRQVRAQVAEDLKRDAMSELKNYLATLKVQGKILSDDKISTPPWMKNALALDRRMLKFGLNALLDTLPSGANRLRWFKCNGDCGRCGMKQTAHHVFSNCEDLLNKGYYTVRHDAILLLLYQFAKTHLGSDWTVWVDLKDCGTDSYHLLPTEWTESEQRPDIVLWNPTQGLVFLVELTVPADIGIAAAKQRKMIRYTDLAQEISSDDRTCKIITIEVGALGSLPKQPLKSFFEVMEKPPMADCNSLLMNLSVTALKESWKIWCARDG